MSDLDARRREALAVEFCKWRHPDLALGEASPVANHPDPRCRIAACFACQGIAALAMPLVAGWLAEAGCELQRTGDGTHGPLIRQAKAEAIADALVLAQVAPRFWQRVRVGSPNECWLWVGPTVGYGHGRFDTPAGQTAHRYAWASANGRIPSLDEVVRHRCDNPPCCNPAHLEIGTQRDNHRDMVARGRADYTLTTCRNGHDRTPENMLLKANGERRCKRCDQEASAQRRANYAKYRCPECDHVATLYNLVKHLAKRHGERVSAPTLRDRADRIGGAR